MAVATAYKQLNMDESPFFDSLDTIFTASKITEYVSLDGERQEWIGTFPTLPPADITGTVTQTKYYDALGELAYKVTGLNHNAATVAGYLENDNPAIVAFFANGDDSFTGSALSDTLNGYNGDDYLNGRLGDDVLRGMNGRDRLYGLGGSDSLVGGDAADRLFGEAGHDTMIGGAGGDGFYFNGASLTANNTDKVKDFSTAEDLLWLENGMFVGLGAGGNLGEARFFSSASATAGSADDATCRIIYNTENGKLFFDADGMGGSVGVHFATLLGHPDELAAVDIKVY